MRFPKLPYSLSRAQTETIQFKGLNYSNNYVDGALADSKNLSAKQYPYMSAREARQKMPGYEGVNALTAWEQLVSVRNNNLYFDNVLIGELVPGEKQFAVINTKLVIFPDKKYVDLSSVVLSSNEGVTVAKISFVGDSMAYLEGAKSELTLNAGDTIEISGCKNTAYNKTVKIKYALRYNLPDVTNYQLLVEGGAFAVGEETDVTVTKLSENLKLQSLTAEMSCSGCEFTENSIAIPLSNFSEFPFNQGDCITISGCSEAKNNISAVFTGQMTGLDYSGGGDNRLLVLFGDNLFTEAKEIGTITLTRAVPDLDYICESENRIWGCSNKDRTIYASALGDPTNFYNYEDGISTCSYAVAVGSEGDFTGCCKLGSSVLFFKNNTLCKMLGSYPAEYTMYSYKMEGVAPGCHKSMQVINETLIYVSEHGVCSYTGSSSSMLSSALEGKIFTDAVGGSDGLRYYLSAKENEEHHLYTFDLKTGIWLREDNTRVVDFARIANKLYYLDSEGCVYLVDCGEPDKNIEWSAQFKPFYEMVSGRKKHSQLLLRTELPSSSWMKIEVRCDDGRWVEVGKMVGAESNTRPFVVPINRCDKFEVRLSGKGPFTLMNMLRKFSLGGVV